MWADHADLISKAYAGSGALKTDFTRTNKRTKMGVLEDGYKSIMRYVKNNYFDGARQDGFDLVTGAWTPRKNPITAISLLADTRPLAIRAVSCLHLGNYCPLISAKVPYIMSFSLFMICAGLTLPRTSGELRTSSGLQVLIVSVQTTLSSTISCFGWLSRPVRLHSS